MKHAGGRPTSYTPELLKKAEQYLKNCETNGALPQLAQMAYMLDVSRKSLYNWGEQHEEFLHILEKVLSLQEFALVKKGLEGEYNPTITKLMLSKHGYRESQDITTDGKALPIPILNGLPSDHSTKEDTRD